MAQIQPPGLQANELHLSDGEQGLSSPGKSKVSMLGKVRNKAKKLRDKFKAAASGHKDETHEGHDDGTDSHDEEDETSSEFNSGEQPPYEQLRSIGALGSEQGHVAEEAAHGGQAAGELHTKTQPIVENASSMEANQGSPAPSTHWTTNQENDSPITPFKSAGPPDALQAVPTEYRSYAVGIPLKESHPAASLKNQELSSPAGEKSSESTSSGGSREVIMDDKDLEPDFLGLPSPPQGKDPAVDGKESLSSPGALRGDENALFQDDLVKPNLSYGESSFGEPSSNSDKVGVLNVDQNGQKRSSIQAHPVPEAEELREDDKPTFNLLPEAGRYSEYGAEPQLHNSDGSSGDTDLKLTRPENATAATAGEDYPHNSQLAITVNHDNSENANSSKKAVASEFGSEDTLEEEPITSNAESVSGNMKVSDGKSSDDINSRGATSVEGNLASDMEVSNGKSSDEINSREATSGQENLAFDLGRLELGDETTGTAENLVDAGEDYYDPGPLAEERQEGLSSKDRSVEGASSNDSPVSSVTHRATGAMLGMKNTVVSELGYGVQTSPGDTNATLEEETREGKLVPGGAKEDEVPVMDRVSRTVEGLKESASSKLGLGYGSSSKASEDDSAATGVSIDGNVKENKQCSSEDESRSASNVGYGESVDTSNTAAAPVDHTTYTQMLYDTTAAARDYVASKVGYRHADDQELKQLPKNSDSKTVEEESDSFMAPGEDHKALSQLITDTVSNSAVAMKQKLVDGFSSAVLTRSDHHASPKSADNHAASPRSPDDESHQSAPQNLQYATTDSSADAASLGDDESSPTSILGRVTNAFNTYTGKQPTSPVQQQHHHQERTVDEERT